MPIWAVIFALTLLASAGAMAQLNIHRIGGTVAPLVPCATGFVFDWTDSCNAITAVIR